MLTREQFNFLQYLLEVNEKINAKSIADNTKMPIEIVDRTYNELLDLGYISSDCITKKGIEAMQYYRVKRAVIIAAGFGVRMVPITLNTPKPLVRVKGNRIIDSCLDALKAAEINEVYIIRGYLGEQFDQLLYKYPNIKFIENPMYNEANNISSVVCAGDLLQNAYIIEADLLVYNKALIRRYQYASNYLGIPVERTDDWCVTLENGFINKMAIGGNNCYQMVGISYWTKNDGKKLFTDVREVFKSPGGKERYWDQVPLDYCINNYRVEVRECDFSDIIEIDTFNELKKIDDSYR